MQINSMVKDSSDDHSFLNSQPYKSSPFADNKEERKMRDIERTVFMRSPRKIDQGDFEVLYFLNLFGVKYILNNELKYAAFMKDKLEL